MRIPLFFTPVPLTLQTFFVLLSGAVLGRKWGAASQVLYLSLGAFGLPVFQGYGYGISHIFGPTGGYLFGFICAAYIVGYFTESGIFEKKSFSIFLAMIAGLVVVYLCGIAWLKLLLGANLKATLVMGLYPFLPGEVVKVIAASYMYLGLRSRL
ncbi:MAG: biotin transporter BioY [Candidatus Omnitrophota bacterium]